MTKEKREKIKKELLEDFGCVDYLIIPNRCRRRAMWIIHQNATETPTDQESTYFDFIDFPDMRKGLRIIKSPLEKYIDPQTIKQLLEMGCELGWCFD